MSFRPWVPDPAALPPAVYEIGARARGRAGARALGARGEEPALPNRVRILAPSGRWAVIEGAALEGAGSGDVAITVRAATSEEIFDVLCKVHDLTRRQRELTAQMRRGLSTEQLAQALCISPYTVKDHLKAIFDKTGVHSRRELGAHLGASTSGRDAAAPSEVA